MYGQRIEKIMNFVGVSLSSFLCVGIFTDLWDWIFGGVKNDGWLEKLMILMCWLLFLGLAWNLL